MATTKFEYHDAGRNTEYTITGAGWRKLQEFTPSAPHLVSKVVLMLRRATDAEENVDVNIYVASSHEPTGSSLCSGAIAISSIATTTGGTWYDISLGNGAKLSASVAYVMVVSIASGAGNIKWQVQQGTGDYAGGWGGESTDAGAHWDVYASYDFYFEEWGEPALLKTVNGLAKASVKTLRSGLAIASGKTFNGLA